VGKDSTMFTIELQMLHMNKRLRKKIHKMCFVLLNLMQPALKPFTMVSRKYNLMQNLRLFFPFPFHASKVSSVSLLQELTTRINDPLSIMPVTSE